MIKTIFRKFENGEIIALLPGISGNRYGVLSYMSLGQHACADYTGVIKATTPATPEEYAPLLRELKQQGYTDIVATTETARKKTYKQHKDAARAFAIETQNRISDNAFSYDEIERITTPLRFLGKRFGLLREFKENGIC